MANKGKVAAYTEGMRTTVMLRYAMRHTVVEINLYGLATHVHCTMAIVIRNYYYCLVDILSGNVLYTIIK